jgi:hypothetical protein
MTTTGAGIAGRARDLLRPYLTGFRASRPVSLARSVRAWLRGLKAEVWRVEGTEKWSGLPISILCAAGRKNRSYLCRLLMGESFRETLLGTKWLWSVSKFLPQVPDCSLIVLAAEKRHLKYLHPRASFFVPGWIDLEIDLCADKRMMKGRRFREDLRKIRKYDLGYELADSNDPIEDFYDNFYRPYIARAHGASASMVPRELMRARMPQCELLYITKKGTIIAGQLIIRDPIRPRLWCLGVRDGSPQYVAEGACVAAYHFALDHLAKQGYRKAGLGWSRAFLRDGVLLYKRRWSPRIVNATLDGFAFSFPRCSRATQSFLLNNPFIFEQAGTLYGALFVPSKTQSSQEPQPLENLYLYAGMSKLVRYLVPGLGAAPTFEPAGEGQN